MKTGAVALFILVGALALGAGEDVPREQDLRAVSEYFDAKAYIADQRKLVEADLAIPEELSAPLETAKVSYLRLLRNEIAARHGYIFDNEVLSRIFRGTHWYYPVTKSYSEELNDFERYNLTFIESKEWDILLEGERNIQGGSEQPRPPSPPEGTLPSRQQLGKGLIAYYPFNGNAKDASGNGYDGVVFGATLAHDRFGRPNQAYRFDGVSNYIQLPKDLSLSLNDHDFTVSAWIQGDRYKDSGDEAIVGNDTGIDGGVLHLVVRDQKPYMGFYNNDSKGHTMLSEGAWYHLVFRYSTAAQTQDIFLNGFREVSSPGHPPFKGVERLVIGRWAGGNALSYSSYFLGTIDDVRIYARALSDEEIKGLYKAKN